VVSASPVSWLQHLEGALEYKLVVCPGRHHHHSHPIHHLNDCEEVVEPGVEQQEYEVVAEVPLDCHQCPARCP